MTIWVVETRFGILEDWIMFKSFDTNDNNYNITKAKDLARDLMCNNSPKMFARVIPYRRSGLPIDLEETND